MKCLASKECRASLRLLLKDIWIHVARFRSNGLGAVCASALVYYLVRPEPVAADIRTETFEYQPKMGVAKRPVDAKALAGSYYRGDGTGFNVYLTLSPGGAMHG